MACKRSAVRSRLPPPSFEKKVNGSPGSPSSRGPGHHPFTVSTGVRIPLGTPARSLYGSETRLRAVPLGLVYPGSGGATGAAVTALTAAAHVAVESEVGECTFVIIPGGA